MKVLGTNSAETTIFTSHNILYGERYSHVNKDLVLATPQLQSEPKRQLNPKVNLLQKLYQEKVNALFDD